ncbi:MAG TPA: hypothetical protein VEU11_09845 [Terriglobales bacterium]|nr:hypothetical protein [Terriglobales bacterium]
MLFVWKGAISVKSNAARYNAGERDTVFIAGRSMLDVRNDFSGETVVVRVEAPPQSR